MLAVEAGDLLVLVDCGADAVQRMLAAGLDPLGVDAVILTHEHPDHISGYPLLLEKLWLLGRRDPIPVYGLVPTLEKAEALFAVFNTSGWDGLPDRQLTPIEFRPEASVLRIDGLTVAATPVEHPVPTVGLRFEAGGASVAYSCDTAPAETVVALARGVDLLIHEGTGHLPGVHSSPAEAAAVAADAGAGRLVLVHAPVDASDDDLDDARAVFPHTAWGHDGDRLDVLCARKRGEGSGVSSAAPGGTP